MKLILGDCLDKLKELEDNSVDSIVTDPPYGLSFMGKQWDYDVPSQEIWEECMRVLKPGGHLLAFAGSRTYHRMAVRIEDAGFEIRDQIMWIYGCLSEDTEILTKKGWKHYHKITKDDIYSKEDILVYDTERDIYKWEKPERWYVYPLNQDTLYRIRGNQTDQLVSKDHNCIVERDGKLVFIKSQDLSNVETMPILSNDFSFLQEEQIKVLQLPMQRKSSWRGVESVGNYWRRNIESTRKQKEKSKLRRKEWGLEGWDNLQTKRWLLFQRKNKICKMPGRVQKYVQKGRVYNGVSTEYGNGNWKTADTNGMCASHRPQSGKQQYLKSNVIQEQLRPQEIRSGTSYTTDLATITKETYSGIIFCPNTSTGAFVARRNGKIFLTGNSGFPKSMNISKQIDKKGGQNLSWFIDYVLEIAEEKNISKKELTMLFPSKTGNPTGWLWNKKNSQGITLEQYNTLKDFLDLPFDSVEEAEREVIGRGKAGLTGGTIANFSGETEFDITAPSTDEAKKWEGWGTALKPAHEPIVMARKPFKGNVANNVLEWGTGGINIDGCRIDMNDREEYEKKQLSFGNSKSTKGYGEFEASNPATRINTQGRFPANVIFDEEAGKLLDEQTGELKSGFMKAGTPRKMSESDVNTYGHYDSDTTYNDTYGDSGGASRFFYCPKTSKKERNEGLDGFEKKVTRRDDGQPYGMNTNKFRPDGSERNPVEPKQNHHPTVKPTDLMLYLIRLVTPKGGVTLDPFMGSGSTGKAAVRGGFDFIGIEREEEYFQIAEGRINYEINKPTKTTKSKVEVSKKVEEKVNQFFG